MMDGSVKLNTALLPETYYICHQFKQYFLE